MARPGIEPRTSDLRVRCPTDCATRPGTKEQHFPKQVVGGSVTLIENNSNIYFYLFSMLDKKNQKKTTTTRKLEAEWATVIQVTILLEIIYTRTYQHVS